MVYFIVFFVFNFCVCVQSNGLKDKTTYPYNSSIIVGSVSKGTYCFGNDKIFDVIKNEPFSIAINVATFSKCCNSGDFNPCGPKKKSNYECKKFQTNVVSVSGGKGISIIKVSKATEDMNTNWVCKFMRTANGELYVSFQTRLKDVEVIIGGEKTTPTIAHAAEYNYIYKWKYNDGDLVDLDCYSTSEGKNRLRYLDSNGTKLIKTDQIETRGKNEKPKLTFRKILTPKHNGDMIDCEHYNKKYNGSIVQRTIFEFNNDIDDRFIKILINNQTLHPITTDGVKSLYHYKYFEGDKLNITCLMIKSVIGSLSFGKDNNEDLKSNIRKGSKTSEAWLQTIELNAKSINEKHLKCEYHSDFYGNNLYHVADIQFHLDHKELSIKGLETKNVIDEYNENERTWIIDYSYDIGETIHLICVAREEKKVYWIFQNTVIKAKKRKKNQFVLEDKHNGKTIICKTNDNEDKVQRVIVKLHKTVKYSTEPLKDESYDLNDIIIPVACVLVMIIIGVMAACFCCWSKRTKLLRAEQNPYANLPEPDLPIPPYPVQWNDRHRKPTNYEEHITDNVFYNSTEPIYPNPQTNKHNKNNDGENNKKDKPIPNIRSKLNNETSIMVDNSTYNINNTPKYSNAHNNRPIQRINNEEVAEYHYIENNAIFNLREDILKNIPKKQSPTSINMKTNDSVTYVEPYASNVHLNTEPNGSNQAQPSTKEGVYDYVYAGRYANKIATDTKY